MADEVAAPAILRRLLVRCLPLLFQQAGLERVDERELFDVGEGGFDGVRGDGRDRGGAWCSAGRPSARKPIGKYIKPF